MVKDSRLEHAMSYYLKTYDKINEIKKEDNSESLCRLFFVNVLINKILFTRLQNASSRNDIKKITNFMKIETMVINDKIDAYRDDTYVLESDAEIKDILSIYCEDEQVDKIMKDLPSRYAKSKKISNNLVQFPMSKKA